MVSREPSKELEDVPRCHTLFVGLWIIAAWRYDVMATLPSGNLPQTVFLIVLLHIVCLFVHVWLFGYVYRAQHARGERTLRFFRMLR
jgi:hypothetical protein